jgi:hypothetical protein
VGTKIPAFFKNGMKAAYSAAFSLIASDNTEGRAIAAEAGAALGADPGAGGTVAMVMPFKQ